MYSFAKIPNRDIIWILNNKTSWYISNNKEWYNNLKLLQNLINVTMRNNAKCIVEGVGIIYFITLYGVIRKLYDVLYVLEIKRNLLYVFAITNKDNEVYFSKSRLEIRNSTKRLAGQSMKRNNLYELYAMSITMKFGSNRLWSEYFGHIRFVILKKM